MRIEELEGIERDAAEHYVSRFDEIERLLNLHIECINKGHHAWSEAIRERIEEMPLSVQCVAIYPNRQECEWEILLGTGGPADRVLVTCEMDGEPVEAVYQHQDWFTPWTTAYGQNGDVVLDFAAQFYFSPASEVRL